MRMVAKYFGLLLICLGLMSATGAFAKEKRKKKKSMKKMEKVEKKKDMMSEDEEGGDDEAAAMGYKYPYGMAGCGLGSLVIKSNGTGGQIGAAFLNATGVQTSGISSGSSNCVLTKGDLAQQEREVYITANLNSLEKEAAQGEGVHLRAFAEVLGCTSGNSYAAFTEVSRSSYAGIFNSKEPKQVLSNYIQTVRAHEGLASRCERLGV